MKKFFGWFFTIIGTLNIITSFIMMAHGVSGSGSQNPGGKLIFGMGFIGLGIWMIKSATKKKVTEEISKQEDHNNEF